MANAKLFLTIFVILNAIYTLNCVNDETQYISVNDDDGNLVNDKLMKENVDQLLDRDFKQAVLLKEIRKSLKNFKLDKVNKHDDANEDDVDITVIAVGDNEDNKEIQTKDEELKYDDIFLNGLLNVEDLFEIISSDNSKKSVEKRQSPDSLVRGRNRGEFLRHNFFSDKQARRAFFTQAAVFLLTDNSTDVIAPLGRKKRQAAPADDFTPKRFNLGRGNGRGNARGNLRGGNTRGNLGKQFGAAGGRQRIGQRGQRPGAGAGQMRGGQRPGAGLGQMRGGQRPNGLDAGIGFFGIGNTGGRQNGPLGNRNTGRSRSPFPLANDEDDGDIDLD